MFSLDKVHIKLRFYSIKAEKTDRQITLDLHGEFSLLAHLSQRLIGELIVYPCTGVSHRCCHCRRCQPFSNIFTSETAWPIKAKFYVDTHWVGGTKVSINGPGHMTKMAAMPIYDKNL